MIIHNPAVVRFLRDSYCLEDLDEIWRSLDRAGTFDFPALSTGLFPAAHLSDRGQYTGYHNVWVRDNVHIAFAHFVVGADVVAVRTVRQLLAFFAQSRPQFEDVIAGRADPGVPMNRPHIRFDGARLTELGEIWSHAQNDALGYVLWLACTLIRERAFGDLEPGERQILALLALYFRAVRYWEDEDSGHWEEERKVEASSIGVVVAALEALRSVMAQLGWTALGAGSSGTVTAALLDALIADGRDALARILPNECIQPGRERAYDSALLFLIFPLAMVDGMIADTILRNVERYLKGEYGVRRYLLDSFWCANYDQHVLQEMRTADVSDDMSFRDSFAKLGDEAQWCIFDPVLSTIYGRRYAKTGDREAARRQIHYFNRSLGQLTDAESGFRELRCPELYYRKGERYVPNDVTPLLWTQGNLMIAFAQMRRTASRMG